VNWGRKHKRDNPEAQLHKAAADYLDRILPPKSWWTTIPAGGGGVIRGAILKRLGYQAGTPDLLICFAGKAHFIELKAKQGRLSAEQVGQMEALNEASVPVEVCRSITDIGLALSRWQIPTREAEVSLGRRIHAAGMTA
jgi:hypothetical protein